jgi:hypothetical protein
MRPVQPLKAPACARRVRQRVVFIPPLKLSTPVSSAEVVRLRSDLSETRAVPPVSRVEPVTDRAVVLQLGSQALSLARRDASTNPEQTQRGAPETETATPSDESDERAASQTRLSDEERRQVQELRRRDREVRTHEQAHKTVAGQHAGAVHLEYEAGPDGKRYAVSGHVPIDVSPVAGDPEATVRKMQTVRRAATASASASGADHQVASHAAQLAQRARAEMAVERYGKAERLGHGDTTPKFGAESVAPGAVSSEALSRKRLAVFA